MGLAYLLLASPAILSPLSLLQAKPSYRLMSSCYGGCFVGFVGIPQARAPLMGVSRRTENLENKNGSSEWHPCVASNGGRREETCGPGFPSTFAHSDALEKKIADQVSALERSSLEESTGDNLVATVPSRRRPGRGQAVWPQRDEAQE